MKRQEYLEKTTTERTTSKAEERKRVRGRGVIWG
jgi:ribosomal protein S21